MQVSSLAYHCFSSKLLLWVTYFTDELSLFARAVKSMIEDDIFQVPSAANTNALETANSLLRWCQENSEEVMLKIFVNTLILHLKSCFSKRFSSLKLRHEKMWEAYHQLRTSHMFRQSCVEFIPLAVQRTAEPAFYQHITHFIFKVLIENFHLLKGWMKQQSILTAHYHQ